MGKRDNFKKAFLLKKSNKYEKVELQESSETNI